MKKKLMIPPDLVDLDDGVVLHVARLASSTGNGGRRYWSLYEPETGHVVNSGYGETKREFILKFLRDNGKLVRLVRSHDEVSRASEWAITVSRLSPLSPANLEKV